MLVQMFSNVINQTVVHNPELRQLLPPTWDETVDSILNNAYQYGREGISKAVCNSPCYIYNDPFINHLLIGAKYDE